LNENASELQHKLLEELYIEEFIHVSGIAYEMSMFIKHDNLEPELRKALNSPSVSHGMNFIVIDREFEK